MMVLFDPIGESDVVTIADRYIECIVLYKSTIPDLGSLGSQIRCICRRQ